MNWNLAKNISVLSLFLLNVCLASLIFVNRPSYTLTAERKNAVITALAKNRVDVYADIPVKFPPMSQIALDLPYYDAYVFIERFLADENIIRTEEYDKTIYSDDGGGVLSFLDNEVLFENDFSANFSANFSAKNVEMTISGATAFCDDIVFRNSDIMPGYELDKQSVIKTEKGFSLQYRQRYNDDIIYSNRVVFTVTEQGLAEMSYTYERPTGAKKEAREIIAPDEALFTLMSLLLNMYRDRDFIIDSIDIVYDRESSGDENARALNVEPCYRFCVEGLEAPFLINAYTGAIE